MALQVGLLYVSLCSRRILNVCTASHTLTTTLPHRFEVVIFTASLSKYADPLLDLLDKWGVVRWRLFR
jgi:hypothetical protein